jgi:WD40 repeat protein
MRHVQSRLGKYALFLFVWVLPNSLCAQASKAANDFHPRTDHYGDPLPDGVIARLGTIRWRLPSPKYHPVDLLRFIQDGNQLLASGGDGISRVFDTKSGKERRRFGSEDVTLSAVTPDGTTIAMANSEARISVWNVGTGKELNSFNSGFAREDLIGLCFIDSEQLMGWGRAPTIKSWDIRSGKLSRVLSDDIIKKHSSAQQMIVSPDGKTLAFSTSAPALCVWDVQANIPRGVLKVAGRWSDSQYSFPVFSPDSRYLAWPETDGTIQLYLSASLAKVRSLNGASKDGRVQGMCFSEDVTTLAIVTRRHTIRFVDIATGRQLREIGEVLPFQLPIYSDMSFFGSASENHAQGPLAWDSRSSMIAHEWQPGFIRIWNSEDGKGNDSSVAHFGSVSGLIVSEDGATAITLGQDNTVRTWDIATAIERRKVLLPPKTSFGRLLGPERALLQANDGSLHVWEIGAKLEAVKIDRNIDKGRSSFTQYDILQNGNSLFTVEFFGIKVSCPRDARLYDLETGKMVADFASTWLKGRVESEKEELASVAYSDKGPHVAAAITVYDTIGGLNRYDRYLLRYKESAADHAFLWESKVTELSGMCKVLSFTPDDRAVLTFNWNQTAWLSLLERTTGNERCRTKMPFLDNKYFLGTHCIFAFSKNGDYLAVSRAGGVTTVLDIRLGIEIAELRGGQGTICCLAFGADETTLFTAGSDGTVLIWDISGQIRKARETANISELAAKRLWVDLADNDTTKAYRAVGALVKAPAQAVNLLREQLKPVKAVPAGDIEKLIDKLDSDNYKTREKASKDLHSIGVQVKQALKKNLETSKSLEHKERVKKLLTMLEKRDPMLIQNELRELRAIEVLETIGTAQALEIIDSLAKGAKGIRLTAEANEAMQRSRKHKTTRNWRAGEP